MKIAILKVFVIMPLGVILTACSQSQRVGTEYHTSSHQPARSTALVFDQRDSSRDEIRSTQLIEPRTARARYDISLDQIRDHVQNKTAVVIDARTSEQFASGHIRGAMNVPAGEVNAYISQINRAVEKDQLIIIYCGGVTCHSSEMVYEHLAAQGFTNMRIYSPGWTTLASAKNLR